MTTLHKTHYLSEIREDLSESVSPLYESEVSKFLLKGRLFNHWKQESEARNILNTNCLSLEKLLYPLLVGEYLSWEIRHFYSCDLIEAIKERKDVSHQGRGSRHWESRPGVVL